MLASNLRAYEAVEIAQTCGIVVHGMKAVKCNRIRFRLRLPPRSRFSLLQYQQYMMWMDGRKRIDGVCWHGHRDFFREVFFHCPGAKIQTQLLACQSYWAIRDTGPGHRHIRWYTSLNFEEVYPKTEGMINPGTLCECVGGNPRIARLGGR